MNFRVFERPAGRTAPVILDWEEFPEPGSVNVNNHFDVNRQKLSLYFFYRDQFTSNQIAFFCEHVVFAVIGVM